jgi:hypothetical protein
MGVLFTNGRTARAVGIFFWLRTLRFMSLITNGGFYSQNGKTVKFVTNDLSQYKKIFVITK